MIGLLLLAAAAGHSATASAATAAAAIPVVDVQVELREIAHAIEAGRYDQAEAMLGDAVKRNAPGRDVGRLVAALAFAKGDYADALTHYTLLLSSNPHDALMLERATVAAFNTSAITQAADLAARATAEPGASWRAWNAAGAIADLNRDFTSADVDYAKALELSPDRPEVLNNVGWSHLLRGDWQGAVEPLQRAASLLPGSTRISDNLDLAMAANDAALPARKPGESDESWSARLNDAGMLAALNADTKRAAAAFAQAIEARPTWYQRAANNLQQVNR